MKYFLINILLLTLFTACSDKNAYSVFDMGNEEEYITTSTQSAKIKDKDNVIGIFNVIYINNTDKIYFDGDEHFLVSIYTKEKDSQLTFKLNNKEAIKVKKLDDVKRFETYIKNPKEWQRHYLVSFKKVKQDLSFRVESSGRSSKVLLFQKF